jgi:hypothetical protein
LQLSKLLFSPLTQGDQTVLTLFTVLFSWLPAWRSPMQLLLALLPMLMLPLLLTSQLLLMLFSSQLLLLLVARNLLLPTMLPGEVCELLEFAKLCLVLGRQLLWLLQTGWKLLFLSLTERQLLWLLLTERQLLTMFLSG